MAEELAATPPITPPRPGLRGFLIRMSPYVLGTLVLLALVAFLSLRRHHLVLSGLPAYLSIYLPVFVVGGYFNWLRAFRPERVPAPLPKDSYLKLKRTGRALFLGGIAVCVPTFIIFFKSNCLCTSINWVAAILISLMLLSLLAVLTSSGIDVYLRERNGTPKVSWKTGTRSDYRRRPISEYKPLTSDHWGQR